MKIFSYIFLSIISLSSFGQNDPIKLKVEKTENQHLYGYYLDSLDIVQYFGEIVRHEEQSFIKYRNQKTLNLNWVKNNSTLTFYSKTDSKSPLIEYKFISIPDSLCRYWIDSTDSLTNPVVHKYPISSEKFSFAGKLNNNNSMFEELPKLLLFSEKRLSLSVFTATR